MTRRGKIARLPRVLRDELNQRIEDGETGARLVEWLNGRPDVQGVLKIHFDGRAINEQNLSEWRAGGYADWQEQQATFDLANGMMDEGAAVAEAMARQAEPGASTGGRSLSDHVGDMAALLLAKMVRALRRMEDGPEQWETGLKIVREVVRLRKSDRELEDALHRREMHEQYEAQARVRAQANAKSPSERLEEILAAQRREFGDMPEGRSTSTSTSAEEGGQAEEMDEMDPPGGETVDPPSPRLRRAGGGGASAVASSAPQDGQADKPVSAVEMTGTSQPAQADKHGVCKTDALQEGAPHPAVPAVPQESSGSIKVNQRSRTGERWIGPWRVGSWG